MPSYLLAFWLTGTGTVNVESAGNLLNPLGSEKKNSEILVSRFGYVYKHKVENVRVTISFFSIFFRFRTKRGMY